MEEGHDMNAGDLKAICAAWKGIFADNCRYLIDLDNVFGDGDIGMVMSDGFARVYEDISASTQTDIGKLVFRCGKVLSAEAPSSMGTLLAIGFMKAGKALVGKNEFEYADIIAMMQTIADSIMESGGAKEGEKTVLDALCPGVRALREHADAPMPEALAAAAAAARQGFEDARGMVARHGRIAFHGEASAGVADPGAAVAAFLFEGIAGALS